MLICSPDTLRVFSGRHHCNLTHITCFPALPRDSCAFIHTHVYVLPPPSVHPSGVLHPHFRHNDHAQMFCWSWLCTGLEDNRGTLCVKKTPIHKMQSVRLSISRTHSGSARTSQNLGQGTRLKYQVGNR